MLVAGEVALACALLVASALLVRTVGRMTETPTGIDANQVVTTTVQLSGQAYNSWRVVGQTHAAIIEQIRQQPGVQAVGASTSCRWRWDGGARLASMDSRRLLAPRMRHKREHHSVSEGYFEALGAQIAERPRLRGFRHSGVGTGGHRQRDVRQALPQRRCSGRPRHHVDDDRMDHWD